MIIFGNFKRIRARLLVGVSIAGLTAGQALATSLTIDSSNSPSTSTVTLSGGDSVTVDSDGTLSQSANLPAITWSGAAAGSDTSVNNAGIISSSATSQPIINSSSITGGTFTLDNSGTITGSFLAMQFPGAPSTATLVVNNSGTITDTSSQNFLSARNLQTGQTEAVVETGIVSGAIAPGSSDNAAMTITNSGTINGALGLGLGTNVVNLTTQSIITGGITTNSTNTTINLSGTGSGFAFGASEFNTTPSSIYNLAKLPTFLGWNNIQTLNVNSGTWNLVGAGAYNTLTIATGAVFNVCSDGPDAACGSAYNGSQSPAIAVNGVPIGGIGTIHGGGIGPLAAGGTLAVANNGQLNIFSQAGDNTITYDPTTNTQALQITGSGALVYNGAGSSYLPPNSSITQGTVELAGGHTLINAGAITAAVTIDSGSTLQIGSGGNLQNINAVVVDDGTTGSVVGDITDNGSLVLDAMTAFSPNTMNITGSGSVTVNGDISLGGSQLSYGGGTTVTDNGALVVDSNVLAANASAFTSGTIVDNGDIELHMADNYVMSGTISGSGFFGYIPDGDPTITITGSQTTAGAIEFDPTTAAGVLQIGNGGTTGSIAGASELDTAGTIAFDRSDTYHFAVPIADDGNPGYVSQIGGGTTVLDGDNSYTGGTTVKAGALIVTGSNVAPVSVLQGATFQIGAGGSGGSLSGGIADNGTAIFDLASNYTYAGALTGSGTLVQAGSGITTLTNAAGFLGNVHVESGTLESSTAFALNGNSVDVDAGATLSPSGTNAIIAWNGATGSNTSVTNAGTISSSSLTQTTMTAGIVTGGTFTLDNSGSIIGRRGALSFAGTPSNASVVINNSGTITSTTNENQLSALNLQTNLTQLVTETGIVGSGISAGPNGEAVTITNSGTINGALGLGTGVVVVNITTASTITGGINDSSTNATINLSGSGSGFAFGASEFNTAPSTIFNLSKLPTFYGWNNIQTLNVNSGTWNLIGTGDYNTLAIASGAVFNVCTDGPDTACGSAYNGSQSPNVAVNGVPIAGVGTIHGGGIGPLNAVGGTLAIANNGKLNIFTETGDDDILYDPATNPQALQITGSGALVYNGAGTIYVSPNSSITQGTIQLTGGGLAIDAGAINAAVTIDSGATLVIGSGGTVTNNNGTVVDSGTSGTVLGSVTDNGTLVFDRLDDFSFPANLSGNGSIIKMNSDTVTLTGIYTYTGTTTIEGGNLIVAGALSPASTLNLGSGTVNLNGTTQTVGGLVSPSGSGGTINLGGGTLVIESSSSSTFSGTITGAGTIIFAGNSNTTLVLNGTSNFGGTVDVDGGTIQIGSSSAPSASLTGSVTVGSGGSLEVGDASSPGAVLNGSVTVAPGGTVGGHGTITGSVIDQGTTAPGGSIGTLSVTGNYTFASGSVLAQDVAANGKADLLQVSGTATIASNVKLQVQPADALTSFARVTNYTIITAGGGVSGSFAGATSTVAGLDPILSYTGNDVNLALVRTDISLGTLGANTDQANAGTAISAGGGAAFNLVAPQSDATVHQALAQETGDIHTTTEAAILEGSNFVADEIENRPAADGINLWGSERAGSLHFSAGSNNDAAHGNRLGVIGGVDVAVLDGVRAGLAAGYTSDKLDISGQIANASVSNLMAAGYLTAGNGPLSLMMGAAASWPKITTQRIVNFGTYSETDTAHYTDSLFALFGEAAWRFELSNSAYAEPLMDVRWTKLGTEPFQEQGGPLALSQNLGMTREVSFVTLGARAGEAFDFDGARLTPHLLAGWELARGSLASIGTFELGNASFNAAGAPVAGGDFKTEAGMDLGLGSFDADLLYTGRFASSMEENDIELRLGYRF